MEKKGDKAVGSAVESKTNNNKGGVLMKGIDVKKLIEKELTKPRIESSGLRRFIAETLNKMVQDSEVKQTLESGLPVRVLVNVLRAMDSRIEKLPRASIRTNILEWKMFVRTEVDGVKWVKLDTEYLKKYVK